MHRGHSSERQFCGAIEPSYVVSCTICGGSVYYSATRLDTCGVLNICLFDSKDRQSLHEPGFGDTRRVCV